MSEELNTHINIYTKAELMLLQISTERIIIFKSIKNTFTINY